MKLVLHPEYELYERKDIAYCSSLQVAQEFDKRHDNVVRDIRELDCSEDFNKLNFEEIRRTVSLGDGRERKDPMFLMTKNGFIFLVMGYRGKKAATIKEAYIKRFDEYEAYIKNFILNRDDYEPFTRAIMDAHDEPKSYHYSTEYDMINRIVLGMDAKHFKLLHGLGNVSSIRPFLSKEQAKAIRKLQVEDISMLYHSVPFQERKSALTAFYNGRLLGR